MKQTILTTTFVALLTFTIGMFSYAGCQQSQDGYWRLNPFAADQIESAAETTTGVFSLLSLFIPGMAGVAGIAAGMTGAYKKMKPGLTRYKNTSQHIVTSIEKIKKNQPELWDKIKTEFKEGTNAELESVIEEIIFMAKAQEKQANV